MKITSKIFLCIAAIAMVSFFSACEKEDYGSSSEKQYVHVDDMQINVESVDFVMGVNGTSAIVPQLSPSSVTPQDLVWTSSNPSVVTVDNNGVLTAHSDGEAVITIASQDRTIVKTCNVSVSHVKLTTLKLSYKDYTLQEGGVMNLSVALHPANAYYQNIAWRTGDASVATVENGKVTAVRAGKVDIIASCLDGLEDTCHVTVKSNTENITFDPYVKVEW
jgi:uncharacterized protein YjdB